MKKKDADKPRFKIKKRELRLLSILSFSALIVFFVVILIILLQ